MEFNEQILLNNSRLLCNVSVIKSSDNFSSNYQNIWVAGDLYGKKAVEHMFNCVRLAIPVSLSLYRYNGISRTGVHP